MSIRVLATPGDGPARLRETIDTQIALSRQLFDSLERLSFLAERLPPPERDQLLKELYEMKELGDQLVRNVGRSRDLIQRVS